MADTIGRTDLLAELRDIERARADPGWAQRPLEDRRALLRRADALHDAYCKALPLVTIARSPITGNLVRKRMDTAGLDGPWWTLGAYDEPPAGDAHVVTYSGAADLSSLKLPPSTPAAGAEIQPGPGVPYVIPRLLSLDGVTCVISSMAMLPLKATVYFMTYFAEPRRPAAQSHQMWLRDTFYYVDPQGFRRWNSCNDTWDFDIAAWNARGKVRWIAPNDAGTVLVEGAKCPYAGLGGVQAPQSIRDGAVTILPRPDGTPKDFFD